MYEGIYKGDRKRDARRWVYSFYIPHSLGELTIVKLSCRSHSARDLAILQLDTEDCRISATPTRCMEL